ncbi:Putative collagen-binding domain of a collagenase [Pseudonocardia ammonioxydans]|uniref:Putative collagen-binding domain of a collagenase n=1 Tax=Pseudonocardia ammonioxydans TaxID=260086 RepID=A0A1I5CHB3_PSUAM|nr:transglycosylase family protein [Pseudonocardia ammonioxydans]SFN86031.1 Putative collagen-binding domain of a collagenase [Pseudonocardia ammonioxydans]
MDIWWGRRSASVLGAALLTVGAVVGGELALGAVLGGSDPPAGGVARTALSPYRDGAFTVRAAAVDRRVGIESARDGSYVLGHAPAGNEVVLDLDLLDGASARPWWVEPATGRVLELAELASEGVARFPAPGAEYWVLVIDDAAAGYASPDAGTIAELVRSVTDGPDQPGQAGSSGGGDVGRLDDAPAAGAGQGRSGPGQDRSGRTDRSNGDDPERENGSGGSPDGGRDSGSSNGRPDDGSPNGGPDGGSFNGGRDGGSSNGGRDGGSPDGGPDDGSPNDGRDDHDHDSGPGDGKDGGPASRGSGNGDDGTADRPETSDHLGPSSGTDPADRTFTGEQEKPDTQQARPEETTQAPTPAPAPEREPAPPPESEPEAAADASWDRLAQCESSGDWAISTGNGYYGGLQFDEPTWREFGGGQFAPTADGASKEQQIEIATKVRDTRGGYGSWPACARELGLPR